MINGVLASIAASFLFGGIYYLSPFMAPLQGEQIFGWRVLLTLPFTTALLLWRGDGVRVRQLLARAWASPQLALGLLVSTFILGVQLWLFMWAPLQGRALPVSLGYFLLPLVMVVVGAFLYREHLSWPQKIATGLAAIGVAHEVIRIGGASWETWVVAIGYTIYFVLRRYMRTDNLAGHWLDMALLVPAAIYFVLCAPSSLPLFVLAPKLFVLLPLLGILSALALAMYMAAHRMLPMNLFGLLSYVEPVLLVLAALLLGETMAPAQWPTYGFVFAAVGVLLVDGLLKWRAESRRDGSASEPAVEAVDPKH